MRIHVGCEMTYEFPQPTPVIAMLNVHASRFSDLERPDHLFTSPAIPLDGYRDSFGIGATAWLLQQGVSLSRPIRSCGITAAAMRERPTPRKSRSKDCLQRACSFFSAAGIARPIASCPSPGISSGIYRPVGAVCRRSAIMCMIA